MIDVHLRGAVAAALPEAIEIVLQTYKRYAVFRGDDAKAYKAHQDACRAAIAHIMLLIKLGEVVRGDAPDEASQEDLDAMILAARAELSGVADE